MAEYEPLVRVIDDGRCLAGMKYTLARSSLRRPTEPKCAGCEQAKTEARRLTDEHGAGWTCICQDCQRRHSAEPTPPAPVEAKATCPRCGSTNLNYHDDRCDSCGVTGKELRVVKTAKPDPYKEHQKRTEQTSGAYWNWQHEQNSRHSAMLEKHKAAHLRDLDRGKAERERNVRHWPSAVSTPGWEEP